MIDWKGVAQPALTRARYYSSAIDGDDGKLTYAALFAFAAQRQADAAIRTLGLAASKWIKGDPIAQTPQRLAEFVAQCCNETGGFTRFEENLNYSAQALANAWPGRYAVNPSATPKVPNLRAQRLAGRPVAIGADTYGLRMGNRSAAQDTDSSPDGWQYRGRGMLQLTGRDNYERYGKLTGLPLVEQPDLAADPADSLVIAREFWRQGAVNAAIDDGDFAGARRITNVGSRFARDRKGVLIVPIGLAQVARIRERLLAILVA